MPLTIDIHTCECKPVSHVILLHIFCSRVNAKSHESSIIAFLTHVVQEYQALPQLFPRSAHPRSFQSVAISYHYVVHPTTKQLIRTHVTIRNKTKI